MEKKLLLSLWLVSQICFIAPQAAAYDLSGDFSVTANPNGPWQYGVMATLGGAFTRHTSHSTLFTGNGIRFDKWSFASSGPEIDYFPSTNTAAGTSDGGQGVYPPGTVVFISDAPYPFGVARFTLPPGASGSYLLQTTARTYIMGPSSGDTDLHILKNGVELYGKFLPGSSSTGYTNILSLSSGDIIDFAVGRGLDGSPVASGLNMQASLTPSICTPHRATAIASNLFGFVVAAIVLDPGCGYTNPPAVSIQGGGGSGATATAVVSNGVVMGIAITSAGSGYTNTPTILIASPPFVPTVAISISKIAVTQHVRVGFNYVLESSPDLVNWTATGSSFTATDENVITEFPVDQAYRYFRIRQLP